MDGGCRLSTKPFKSEAEELANDVGLLSCKRHKENVNESIEFF